MKLQTIGAFFLGIILFTGIAYAAPSFTYQPSLIPVTTSTYTLGTTTKTWLNIYVDQVCLTSDTCRTTWPSGGGGGGGSGNVSTSSVPVIGNLAYWTTNTATPSLLGTVATSSPTFSSPLTTSGTIGYLVGGSGFTVGCQTASGSQAGCLSSGDWTTFNGKQATISATWPILFSANTVSWGGLSTTTNLTSGQVVYASGAGSITSVATSSLGVTAPITFSGTLGSQIGGTGGNFACATCSTAVGANPSAVVGTAAINGSSANFMRADGAPAINQAMAPTWTGLHTFNTGGIIDNASSTFTGVVQMLQASTTNLEMVQYASDQAGADIGAKINNAYAALPSTGGIIVVPAGTYSFSTPITITTSGKTALIQCAPGNESVLTYTGTATSTKFNAAGLTNGHRYDWGMRDCSLVGPNNNAYGAGIEIGGSVGAEGITFSGVKISNFYYGIGITSNTWVTNFDRGAITGTHEAIIYESGGSNYGERLNFTNSVFFDNNNASSSYAYDNCIDLSGNVASADFTNDSFDDCWFYIGGGDLSVNIDGGHFENPGVSGGASPYIYIATSTFTNVHVSNLTMMNDANAAGDNPSRFIWNAGNLQVDNVSLNKNGTQTVANFLTNKQDFQIKDLWFGNTTAVTNVYNDIGNPSADSQGTLDYLSSKQSSWGMGFKTSSDNHFTFFNGGNSGTFFDANNLWTFTNGWIAQASSTVVGNLTTTGTNTFGGALNVAGQTTLSGTIDLNNNSFVPNNLGGIFFENVGNFDNGIVNNNTQGIIFAPNTALGGGAQSRTYFDINGNWGFGTSTPSARVAISLNNKDVQPGNNAFFIASSTASATTTLFLVTNAGTVTFPVGPVTIGSAYTSSSGILGLYASTNVTGRRGYTFEGDSNTGFKLRRWSDNFGAAQSSIWSVDNSIAADTFNIQAGAFSLAAGTPLYFSNDLVLNRDAANILAQRNGTNAQTFRLYNTFTDATNYERATFDWSNTANVLRIGTENGPGGGTARRLDFITGSTTAMTINTAQLVGIGTSTPAWALTVASSTGPQIALTDTTAGSNAWTFRSKGNTLYIATSTATATSTTAAVAIDPNGKITMPGNVTVGLPGTSALDLLPGSTFNIQGHEWGQQLILSTHTSGGSVNNNELYLNAANGNIGLSVANPGQNLTVAGSVGFPGIGNGAGTAYVCETLATGVLSTSTTACNPSSLRVKDNITPLTSGIDAIMKLKPVSFTYKPSVQVSGPQIGFIAEDMIKVFPQIVGLDAQGLPANIDYAKLVSPLTRAVQQIYTILEKVIAHQSMQDKQIAQLQAQLKAQQKEINMLIKKK